MTSTLIYYVYIYRHPLTNVPFYVGYGKNGRSTSHLLKAMRKPDPKPHEHKLNAIRKLLRDGLKPKIEIVDSGLSKDVACELEIFLISKIGRADLGTGPLTNKTSGGDGNRDWSDDARKKASENSVGMIMAKDPITGQRIRVHKDDPRWGSGELVGQNFQEVNSNKNGALSGLIMAKDGQENIFRVHKDDPRWVSGELVGINSGKKAHPNTIEAAKRMRGIPKSEEHNKKNSAAIKLLKWYCNFETGKVGRFKENEQPSGFVRVSGPHKRNPI